MNISKHFTIQEFVYPELYNQWGDKSIYFLDQRIVNVAEFIREKINKPITINNWHTGGQYKESGLRSLNTSTGGALSQHKFGRAADLKVQGMTPAQVLQFIKDNWAELHALGLTTVEDIAMTPTWLHIDVRWTGLSELLIVKP